ncbi:MAG: DUF3180 domain-containing protein [Cryobacterium sp.]
MKRTGPTPLMAIALAGLVVGFLIDVASAATGRPTFVPPVSMAASLAAIGIVVVALAWPIRQVTKGTGRRRVDPFVAMRVAVLAKASALSGALFLGGGLGILLYVTTRTVQPHTASLWLVIGTAGGAAVLLAGGLVAEHFCTLPPDKPEEERQNDTGGLHA